MSRKLLALAAVIGSLAAAPAASATVLPVTAAVPAAALVPPQALVHLPFVVGEAGTLLIA